jgi:hypothetical protein
MLDIGQLPTLLCDGDFTDYCVRPKFGCDVGDAQTSALWVRDIRHSNVAYVYTLISSLDYPVMNE